MRVEYDKGRGITVHPDGLFDYAAGHECIAKTEVYLRDYGAVQITVDFRQTTFMDSSGIGALIALMRKLPPQAPAIKLIHPSKSVQKLMEVCHLHRLFEIEVESDT
jgi:stage II sporulation protein AA (anti-sigma F factor antagonist)